MSKITPEQAVSALETAAKICGLSLEVQHRVNNLAVIDSTRGQTGGALAGSDLAGGGPTEAAAENSLARFKAQYENLPRSNILAADSTWETVQARLSDPQNAVQLRKVTQELQGGGRLYAVMEDGSLEFVDDNSDTPPMFVREKKTGDMQIIFKRNSGEMATAYSQIRAGTHQWASAEEMLGWAKANGFEVFEADTKDKRWFGKEMKLAEAASPTGRFVGDLRGPWMATALKDGWVAFFQQDDGCVHVEALCAGFRNGALGLIRRLTI